MLGLELPFLACLLAQAAPEDLDGWLERRLRELEPTASERKLDRVGWAARILDAERIARERRRPVFLFTHDGRMGTGRC